MIHGNIAHFLLDSSGIEYIFPIIVAMAIYEINIRIARNQCHQSTCYVPKGLSINVAKRKFG